MRTYDFLLKRIAGSVAVLALAATAASAAAPDVTVTDAKIAAGKLVITGKTATPRTKLRLDGKSGADFNVTSKADKSFSFSLVYLPKDCVVTLEKLSASAKAAGSTELVVANCAPTRISPRGVWTKAERYDMLDLVTHRDASWLARRDNAGTEPSEGSDWQLFAARSDAEESSGDDSADQAGTDAAASDAADADREAQRVPPTGPAGGDLNGTYPNPSIRAGSVVANKIAAAAVVTNKIANNAVTNTKIAPAAVGTGKLANGAVTNLKIRDDAVTTNKILDAAITTNKIANDAVSSDKIAAAAVINSRLGADAVTTDKILDGTITGADVLDETLTDVDLASNSVGQAEIQSDGVAATEIANDAIDSGEIVDNSLFAVDLGPGSVRGSELGTITRRSQVSAAIAAGATGSALATCLAGERVIAGGNDGSLSSVVVASREEANGWRVFIRNNGGGNTTVTAHAYCLQAS